MQLRHLRTALLPGGAGEEGDGGFNGAFKEKVTAVAWAPNNQKFAVCTADRVVTLFDENGEKMDKFSTKPADKGPKNYIVRALAFSPDSSKLGVAQSDCIVFVYKLGNDWGEKKSICNKFLQTSPVTSMCWPEGHPNDILFGLAEGKIKIGQLKTNKPATLYNTDSYVTALATSPDGNGVVSAHLDGSLYRFFFDDNGMGPSHARLCIHPSVPYALSWGRSIVAAGNDAQVIFYDIDGGMERTFDYSREPKCKEFTVAAFNPTGDAVVIGNYNCFYIYGYNLRTDAWDEVGVKTVENLYSVTAMAWKCDGSRLAVGALCGVLDLYDACIRRTRYRGRFEFTYVSQSQVIVMRLGSGSRIVLKSHFGCEIVKINIFQDRYVVASTTETLLLGDLETFKLSEIPWQSHGATEKFIFDNPVAALVFAAGELSVVEYGHNEILGAVRTDYISGHLLSMVLNERSARGEGAEEHGCKKVAYLLDLQTINVKDLVSQASNPISHDAKVDWLELNGRGNLLLFRDKQRQLHLFNLDTQIRSTLLNYCTYVQWVPDSDVVVAQNRTQLCVWYNIHAPDQMTSHEIKGDIYEIERAGGRTEVIVNEGFREASYLLDEALIEFGTAIDDRDYARAMDILEPLEVTPEAEAMWQQLSEMALAHGDIAIAERCAAALGDVARAAYLEKIGQTIEEESKECLPLGLDPRDHWSVRYRLCLLRKDVQAAEDVLVAQGRVQEAIDMHDSLLQYEDAMSLAKARRLPDEEVSAMSQRYFKLLLDTKQEERAAFLKEREGDYEQAIKLFLKGGLPAHAARILDAESLPLRSQWLDTVASALSAAGLHDRAGSFYEQMDQLRKAMDSYIKGHAYRQAVELARRSYPAEVVGLEEMWGDWLVRQKQVDMAINHYIEARVNNKAIEACLSSRQWTKAAQLIEAVDPASARPYYKQLARHYEEVKQYDQAERFFAEAGVPQLAVEMYTKANKWEAAHKLANSYMTEGEVRILYINQAQKMEAGGKLREAEKLYLQVEEVDLAISMYKKHRKFDAMVRLVSSHRAELLKETHQFLAQQLEMEGSMKEAEHHYAEAGEWLSAINMYRSNDQWEDALRVAKYHGGPSAQRRVAYAWALALGGDAGAKLLQKQGLIEPAIDYATESGAFEHAFELARAGCPGKLCDVHLKHAMYLEDEERFAEAEAEFVQAGKPHEAVEMYLHQKDWAAAMRIAEAHEPDSVPEIYAAQAEDAAVMGNLGSAEELWLAALQPDKALAMYEDKRAWTDALRIAQRHLPHKLSEVQSRYQAAQAATGKGGSKSDYISAARAWESSGSWSQAIDAYLHAKKGVLGPQDLEELWDKAVAVARAHAPNRLMEVVREVARRLCDISRHASAADLLADTDQVEEAIDAAIAGGAWEKARLVAKGRPALLDQVERAHQRFLVQGEAAEELVELGQTSAALDILANRGQWDRLWETAAKQGVPAAALGRYVAQRVSELIKESSDRSSTAKARTRALQAAVETLTEHGAPPVKDHLPMYEGLVRAVLGQNKDMEEAEDQVETLMSLRSILFRLAQAGGRGTKDIEHLLMASHYSALLAECTASKSNVKDCLDLAARMSITLLRYCDILPADKCFFRAGTLAKQIGQDSLAFVLLNRYVDLTEAIEEGDASQIDNTDFAHATSVPIISELPKHQYMPDDADREKVRDWVLGLCVDSNVEQQLPSEAEAAGTMYAGLFASDQPTCIVTGYPVSKRDLLEINDSRAGKREWNMYVRNFRACPWTRQEASPVY